MDDLFEWALSRPPEPKKTPIFTSIINKPMPLETGINEVLLTPLRDYQQDAFDAIQAHFGTGKRRALLVAGTGSGKTVIMSALAAQEVNEGGSVLILTDQIDLVDQAINKIGEVTGLFADAD